MKGNEFYKKNHLLKAKKSYRRATWILENMSVSDAEEEQRQCELLFKMRSNLAQVCLFVSRWGLTSHRFVCLCFNVRSDLAEVCLFIYFKVRFDLAQVCLFICFKVRFDLAHVCIVFCITLRHYRIWGGEHCRWFLFMILLIYNISKLLHQTRESTTLPLCYSLLYLLFDKKLD